MIVDNKHYNISLFSISRLSFSPRNSFKAVFVRVPINLLLIIVGKRVPVLTLEYESHYCRMIVCLTDIVISHGEAVNISA